MIYSLRLFNPRSSPIPGPQADDGQAAAHIWQRYRVHLHSFCIGNEPDWHSCHTSPGDEEDPRIYETGPGVPGSAYPSFLSGRGSFAQTVLASARGATISAPDTGCYNTGTFAPDPSSGVSWTGAFATSEKGSSTIVDVTTHYYVGGSYGQTTIQQEIDNMLSPEWVQATEIGTQPAGAASTSTYTPYPWEYRYHVGPVLAAGPPCRLAESND